MDTFLDQWRSLGTAQHLLFYLFIIVCSQKKKERKKRKDCFYTELQRTLIKHPKHPMGDESHV
jgi:hypothetical protein